MEKLYCHYYESRSIKGKLILSQTPGIIKKVGEFVTNNCCVSLRMTKKIEQSTKKRLSPFYISMWVKQRALTNLFSHTNLQTKIDI